MLFKKGRPSRYFVCTWEQVDFDHLGIKVGDCAAQTFFEVLVLVLAVELSANASKPAVILGDNLPALQEALDLKGKGAQEPLAQALAVVVSARSLALTVAHLPTEANDLADALSRQSGPANAPPWPFTAAQHEGGRLHEDAPVSPSELWGWIA